jgi:drug/metabolite transporter (DMT)-like permease
MPRLDRIVLFVLGLLMGAVFGFLFWQAELRVIGGLTGLICLSFSFWTIFVSEETLERYRGKWIFW